MRNNTRLLFLVAFLTVSFVQSCKISQIKAKQKYPLRECYVEQFKLTYLKKILGVSYNNSEAVQEIFRLDNSGFGEPLLTDGDFSFLDSIVTLQQQEILKDSIEGKNRAEGSKGKRPLGYILEKLESDWLDKTARSRFKLSGLPKDWWKD